MGYTSSPKFPFPSIYMGQIVSNKYAKLPHTSQYHICGPQIFQQMV